MPHRLIRTVEAPEPESVLRTAEPDQEPVKLEEAKEFLRISAAVGIHDARIKGFIAAATRTAEDFCKRAFILQEWTISFDAIPFDFFSIPDIPRIIRLPRPRLLNLDEVRFFNEDGTESTFTLTNLIVDSNSEPARLLLKRGVTWPTGLRDIDAVHIKYRAGYGVLAASSAADVPEAIKLGIMQMVATWFENREDEVVGAAVNKITRDSRITLLPYRIMTL